MKLQISKADLDSVKNRFNGINRNPLTDDEQQYMIQWTIDVIEKDLDGHSAVGSDELWLLKTPEVSGITTFENSEGDEYSIKLYSMSREEKFISVRTKEKEFKQWYEKSLGGELVVCQGPTIRTPMKEMIDKKTNKVKEFREGDQTHFIKVFIRGWEPIEIDNKKGAKNYK